MAILKNVSAKQIKLNYKDKEGVTQTIKMLPGDGKSHSVPAVLMKRKCVQGMIASGDLKEVSSDSQEPVKEPQEPKNQEPKNTQTKTEK